MASHTLRTDSRDVPLFEFRDTDPDVVVSLNPPLTPEHLLAMMRDRVRRHGSPLPDGFVPPPGIDLPALLKQVPWPPAG